MTFVPYFEYLRSEPWKLKAEAAKARAGHRCQVCNSADRLDVHHRTYERLGRELDSDLTVLCRPCHQLFEDYLAQQRERRSA
jgi:5-methylcytosine-specific restriction endonuclease McrA